MSQFPVGLISITEYFPYFRRKAIRGALTTGMAWKFFALTINPNGEYWVSQQFEILQRRPPLCKEKVDVQSTEFIANILLHWVGLHR